MFYDILERKTAFLGYKNNKFKKWKSGDFCNVVNPWFWSKNSHCSNLFFRQYRSGFGPKIANFQTFFLGNIGQEYVFDDILERKNAFLGYLKKTSSKSRKIEIFSKGLTREFGQKIAIFRTFL